MNKFWRLIKLVLGFERKSHDDLAALRETLAKEFMTRSWDLGGTKVALAMRCDAILKQDKDEQAKIEECWQEFRAYRSRQYNSQLVNPL